MSVCDQSNIYLPPAGEELLNAIRRQVEYYFSPENLAKDTFLLSHMAQGGWVSITVIGNFHKIRALTNDLQLLVEAVRSSKLVRIDPKSLYFAPVPPEIPAWLHFRLDPPVAASSSSSSSSVQQQQQQQQQPQQTSNSDTDPAAQTQQQHPLSEGALQRMVGNLWGENPPYRSIREDIPGISVWLEMAHEAEANRALETAQSALTQLASTLGGRSLTYEVVSAALSAPTFSSTPSPYYPGPPVFLPPPPMGEYSPFPIYAPNPYAQPMQMQMPMPMPVYWQAGQLSGGRPMHGGMGAAGAGGIGMNGTLPGAMGGGGNGGRSRQGGGGNYRGGGGQNYRGGRGDGQSHRGGHRRGGNAFGNGNGGNGGNAQGGGSNTSSRNAGNRSSGGQQSSRGRSDASNPSTGSYQHAKAPAFQAASFPPLPSKGGDTTPAPPPQSIPVRYDRADFLAAARSTQQQQQQQQQQKDQSSVTATASSVGGNGSGNGNGNGIVMENAPSSLVLEQANWQLEQDKPRVEEPEAAPWSHGSHPSQVPPSSAGASNTNTNPSSSSNQPPAKVSSTTTHPAPAHAAKSKSGDKQHPPAGESNPNTTTTTNIDGNAEGRKLTFAEMLKRSSAAQ